VWWPVMRLLMTVCRRCGDSVLADSSHPEHAERLDWVGGPFDPARFDLDDADRALHRLAWRPLTPIA